MYITFIEEFYLVVDTSITRTNMYKGQLRLIYDSKQGWNAVCVLRYQNLSDTFMTWCNPRYAKLGQKRKLANIAHLVY